MSGDIVRFDWGPFMSSCYISIMSGESYGPTLHLSGEGSDAAARILSGLTGLVPNNDYDIDFVRPHLPPKGAITWQDELRGDDLFGWEIRGAGSGFRACMTYGGGGSEPKLSEHQKADRLSMLQAAIRAFYP